MRCYWFFGFWKRRLFWCKNMVWPCAISWCAPPPSWRSAPEGAPRAEAGRACHQQRGPRHVGARMGVFPLGPRVFLRGGRGFSYAEKGRSLRGGGQSFLACGGTSSLKFHRAGWDFGDLGKTNFEKCLKFFEHFLKFVENFLKIF